MKRSRTIPDNDFDVSAALVARDYTNFLGRAARGEMTPEEIKEFANRHGAARTALAHLEHLKKVAGPNDEAAIAARQQALLAARAAIGTPEEAADDGDE